MLYLYREETGSMVYPPKWSKPTTKHHPNQPQTTPPNCSPTHHSPYKIPSYHGSLLWVQGIIRHEYNHQPITNIMPITHILCLTE